MEAKNIKNRIFDILFITWSAFLVLSLMTNTVFGQTIRRGGDFLQVGDVTTTHILNATIADIDISATAGIDATKIRGGLRAGLILLANGTQIATSTNFFFATSTNDLYIFTGRVHATTTNIN